MFRKVMLVSLSLGLGVVSCGLAQASLKPTTKQNLVAQKNTTVAQVNSSSASVQTLFAVVQSNGTLARGLGNISSRRVFTGGYEVIFGRDVRSCAYTATLGVPGLQNTTPGEIVVGGRRGNSNAVFVATYNSTGSPSNNGFHLTVTCPDIRSSF